MEITRMCLWLKHYQIHFFTTVKPFKAQKPKVLTEVQKESVKSMLNYSPNEKKF